MHFKSSPKIKYFSGTAISISLVLPAAWVVPVMFTLNLKDSESFVSSLGPSL